MNELTTYDDLPLETLERNLLLAFDDVGDIFEAIDKKWKHLEHFGKMLAAAKRKVPYGEWSQWLETRFNGKLAYRTAHRWISEAEAPEKAEDRKKKGRDSSQKRIDGRVEVVELDLPHVAEVDDDPAPTPPTNRKTAAGSKKVSEAYKPKTQPVVPEIVEDDPKYNLGAWVEPPEEKTLSDFCEHEILEFLIATADDAKRRAKAMRKAADKLDPPTKFVKPEREDVSAFMTEIDSKSGKTAADDFCDHYQSNGWMVGKVPMKDWKSAARKWLKNQGQFKTGNGSSNGQRTAANADPESCLGPNGRPKIERAKIVYK